jgi:zinc and cadmium transporter
MPVSYNLLLFIITLIGGSIPLWTKPLNDRQMHYLLAFSGSFLLSITFLHLLPEAFAELGNTTGFLLLAGFFLQLLIQRLTHGAEHGHSHIDTHDHRILLAPVLTGLTIHAFMEGLPLGVHYLNQSTAPSLYLAVAAHKLPEAMLTTTLVLHTKDKKQAFFFLLFFSLITPVASILANTLSIRYEQASRFVTIILPVVAGAFIHISTTIFFESGTKQHTLSWQKTLAILAGLGMGLITLIFE